MESWKSFIKEGITRSHSRGSKVCDYQSKEGAETVKAFVFDI